MARSSWAEITARVRRKRPMKFSHDFSKVARRALPAPLQGGIVVRAAAHQAPLLVDAQDVGGRLLDGLAGDVNDRPAGVLLEDRPGEVDLAQDVVALPVAGIRRHLQALQPRAA